MLIFFLRTRATALLRISSIYLVALLSCLPLLVYGFPEGHDTGFELVRIAEYRHALEMGQWPPYWASNLYSGYGSPIFLFYAPLFLFVASSLSWPVGTVGDSASLALIGFSCLGAFGMYRLACTFLPREQESSRTAARIAAYLYLLSPYVMGDKLIRNANAEFTALCVAPVVFYSLRLIDSRPRSGFVWLSVALGLSLTAHNLTALVTFALASLVAVVTYPPWRHIKQLILAASGMALGLLLAGFFWIPALSLKSLVRIDNMLTGKFDFHNQFQPFLSNWGYEGFFASGALLPVVLLLGAGSVVARLKEPDARRNILIGLLLLCLVFVFLQMPASTFVWENVPFLPLFQFPWRMQGPLAALGVLVGALTFHHLAATIRAKTLWLAEGVILLVALLNAAPLLQQYRPMTDTSGERFEKLLQPDQIRLNRLKATVANEFLPRQAVDPRHWTSPTSGSFSGSLYPLQGYSVTRDGNAITARVNSKRENALYLSSWAFPVWQAWINGRRAELRRSDRATWYIDVPAGDSTLVLMQQAPEVRRWSLYLSLSAAAIWLLTALGVFDRFFRRMR